MAESPSYAAHANSKLRGELLKDIDTEFSFLGKDFIGRLADVGLMSDLFRVKKDDVDACDKKSDEINFESFHWDAPQTQNVACAAMNGGNTRPRNEDSKSPQCPSKYGSLHHKLKSFKRSLKIVSSSNAHPSKSKRESALPLSKNGKSSDTCEKPGHIEQTGSGEDSNMDKKGRRVSWIRLLYEGVVSRLYLNRYTVAPAAYEKSLLSESPQPEALSIFNEQADQISDKDMAKNTKSKGAETKPPDIPDAGGRKGSACDDVGAGTESHGKKNAGGNLTGNFVGRGSKKTRSFVSFSFSSKYKRKSVGSGGVSNKSAATLLRRSDGPNLWAHGKTTLSLGWSCRGLSRIPLEKIQGVKSDLITRIYLNDNGLSSIPAEFFELTPNLTCLDLSDNFLTSIEIGPNAVTTKLRQLEARGNLLTKFSIPRDKMLDLSHLDLSDNQISEMPENLFVPERARRLTYVDLSNNRISVLPPDIALMIYSSNPKILKLSLNPLKIDSGMSLMKEATKRTGESFVNHLVSNFPDLRESFKSSINLNASKLAKIAGESSCLPPPIDHTREGFSENAMPSSGREDLQTESPSMSEDAVVIATIVDEPPPRPAGAFPTILLRISPAAKSPCSSQNLSAQVECPYDIVTDSKFGNVYGYLLTWWLCSFNVDSYLLLSASPPEGPMLHAKRISYISSLFFRAWSLCVPDLPNDSSASPSTTEYPGSQTDTTGEISGDPIHSNIHTATPCRANLRLKSPPLPVSVPSVITDTNSSLAVNQCEDSELGSHSFTYSKKSQRGGNCVTDILQPESASDATKSDAYGSRPNESGSDTRDAQTINGERDPKNISKDYRDYKDRLNATKVVINTIHESPHDTSGRGPALGSSGGANNTSPRFVRPRVIFEHGVRSIICGPVCSQACHQCSGFNKLSVRLDKVDMSTAMVSKSYCKWIELMSGLFKAELDYVTQLEKLSFFLKSKITVGTKIGPVCYILLYLIKDIMLFHLRQLLPRLPATIENFNDLAESQSLGKLFSKLASDMRRYYSVYETNHGIVIDLIKSLDSCTIVSSEGINTSPCSFSPYCDTTSARSTSGTLKSFFWKGLLYTPDKAVIPVSISLDAMGIAEWRFWRDERSLDVVGIQRDLLSLLNLPKTRLQEYISIFSSAKAALGDVSELKLYIDDLDKCLVKLKKCDNDCKKVGSFGLMMSYCWRIVSGFCPECKPCEFSDLQDEDVSKYSIYMYDIESFMETAEPMVEAEISVQEALCSVAFISKLEILNLIEVGCSSIGENGEHFPVNNNTASARRIRDSDSVSSLNSNVMYRPLETSVFLSNHPVSSIIYPLLSIIPGKVLLEKVRRNVKSPITPQISMCPSDFRRSLDDVHKCHRDNNESSIKMPSFLGLGGVFKNLNHHSGERHQDSLFRTVSLSEGTSSIQNNTAWIVTPWRIIWINTRISIRKCGSTVTEETCSRTWVHSFNIINTRISRVPISPFSSAMSSKIVRVWDDRISVHLWNLKDEVYELLESILPPANIIAPYLRTYEASSLSSSKSLRANPETTTPANT